jgi:hypothetical protein
MLHEVLLALLGYSGNIFVEDKEDFHIAHDISFQYEGEKNLLNRIVNLGFYYKIINGFVQTRFQTNNNSNGNNGSHFVDNIIRSLYSRSLFWFNKGFG